MNTSLRSGPRPEKVLITARVLAIAEQRGISAADIEETYYAPTKSWDILRDGEYDGEVLVRDRLAIIVSADDRVVAMLPARKALAREGFRP